MKRDEILAEAERLTTGDRQDDYGDASESFARVGVVWGAILGIKHALTATDVALMMAALKIIRATESPTKADNWVDLAGYAALGGEIAAPRREATAQEFQAAQGPTGKARCPELAPDRAIEGRCILSFMHDGKHEAFDGETWA